MAIKRLFVEIEPTVKVIILSERRWGQPKLETPKELKGIKRSFVMPSNYNRHNARKCPVYIVGDDVYVFHKDWFSASYKPSKYCLENTLCSMNDVIHDFNVNVVSKHEGMKPISEYYRGKFMYNDNWGEIVLCNHAWIKLENLMYDIKNDCKKFHIEFSVLRQLEKLLNIKFGNLDEISRLFFGDVVYKCNDIYVNEWMEQIKKRREKHIQIQENVQTQIEEDDTFAFLKEEGW